MDERQFHSSKKSPPRPKDRVSPAFNTMMVLLLLVVVAAVTILSFYHPAPSAPQPKITLEQKIAHLESGTPLPGQETTPAIPRWMMMIILGFVLLQIFPLALAAHKARSSELTPRDVRQIEFLAETPLFLGLLGSLLGVSLTHFLSGTLSAPLAYLTTISGILLFLFGRFTILLSIPTTTDSTLE